MRYDILKIVRNSDISGGDKMAQTIGERLKIARKTAHIRQEDAAIKMEMSRPTLSAIEKDKRTVLAEEVVRFADLYQVDAMELLYGFKNGSTPEKLDPQKRRLQAYFTAFSQLNALNQKKVIDLMKELKDGQ